MERKLEQKFEQRFELSATDEKLYKAVEEILGNRGWVLIYQNEDADAKGDIISNCTNCQDIINNCYGAVSHVH